MASCTSRQARFLTLIQLPGAGNIGKAINEAMKAIEQENEELKDVLPKSYHTMENRTSQLLKTFNSIPMDVEGDVFGKIYEYFLGEFPWRGAERRRVLHAHLPCPAHRPHHRAVPGA